MVRRRFRPGELVVYRRTEVGLHPDPRARLITPTAGGEGYTYCVNKYWLVLELGADNRMLVRTRGGGEHWIAADDPNLRRATLFEKLWTMREFWQRSTRPEVV